MFEELENYLKAALNDPSLKVLDSDISRAKLLNVLHASSGKGGMVKQSFGAQVETYAARTEPGCGCITNLLERSAAWGN